MNMKSILNRHIGLETVKATALGIGASLLGSTAALVGGIGLSLGTALIIGIACFIFLHYLRKTKAPVIPRTNNMSMAPQKNSPIPEDRIDNLTGLANENGLMAWFEEKGSRFAAEGKGIIVLSADLVDIGQVERSRGNDIADAVRIEVAKRIATCAGEEGIAARTSGDEFAVVASVVPKHSNEIIMEQAGKLAELIQRPIELPSGVVWIGGSVGAAAGSPVDGTAVLARAREALKKAKKLGRGHYMVDNSEKKK
jgi:diguanylate cyclase (GGDEF)-like protein